MAGKTGTAQVRRLEKRTGGQANVKFVNYWERDNAWFVAFAPAEDPEIAVVALTEHSGFGGAESAPVVAAVVQKYFDLKDEDSGLKETAAASQVHPQAPRTPEPTMPKVAPPPAVPRAMAPPAVVPPELPPSSGSQPDDTATEAPAAEVPAADNLPRAPPHALPLQPAASGPEAANGKPTTPPPAPLAPP
jgi:hypothetical protein